MLADILPRMNELWEGIGGERIVEGMLAETRKEEGYVLEIQPTFNKYNN